LLFNVLNNQSIALIMPHKRIIVCCDGTWNNADGTGQVPTNVAKLARCIDNEAEVLHEDGKRVLIKQIVYYQRGIGSVGGWLFGKFENAIEGATGRGTQLAKIFLTPEID
jgi:uncharacterized protein (DUF2235 family)